ncbi:MAG: LysM peptidoglycan-binding domain-containing protein [Pirellulales bacterium]
MSKESRIALLLLAALAGWGAHVYRQDEAGEFSVADRASVVDSGRGIRGAAIDRDGSRFSRQVATSPVRNPARIERPSDPEPEQPPELVDVVVPPFDNVERNLADPLTQLDERELPIRMDLEPQLAENPVPVDWPVEDEPLAPVAVDNESLPDNRYDLDALVDADPPSADADRYDQPLAETPPTETPIKIDINPPVAVAADVPSEPVRTSPVAARPAIRARTLPQPKAGPTAPPAEGNEFIVYAGDEFFTISQRLFGTGGYGQAIAQHNRARLPTDGTLAAGDVLNIPSAAELRRLYPQLCPQVAANEESSPTGVGLTVSRPRARLQRRTYTVGDGESLFDIARTELGRADRWVDIYQLNQSAIGETVDYLAPGTVLTLPYELASDQTTSRPGGFNQRR